MNAMENKKDLLDIIDEESDCSSDAKVSKLDKYIYTTILCYANLTYGIALTCMTPALIDFSKLLEEDSPENIMHYYTLFAIGIILGSMFGFLFKYINRQLTLIIVLILFGLATGFQPQSPTLIILYVCGFFSGLGAGALDTIQTVWMIEMWKEKCGPILLFSECIYGVGCIMGPLIVGPFLQDEQVSNSTSNISTVFNNETINYRKNLTTPFAMSGSFLIIGSFALIIMYVYHEYIPLPKTEEEIGKEIEEVLRPIEKIYHRRYSVQIIKENPISLAMHHTRPRFSIQVNNIKIFQNMPNQSVFPIRRRFSSFQENEKPMYKPLEKLPRKTMLAISAFGFATIMAAEAAYIDFSPTFFQLSSNISGSKSAILLSVMTASYSLTRFASVFIAMKVKPKYILSYHYLILFIGLTVLYFSKYSIIVIWFGNIIYGVGTATFWSAILSHMEQYLEITDKIGSIYVLSVGVMQAGTQFIAGPLIEEHPEVVLYYCSFAAIISFICFLLIRLIVWKTKKISKSNNIYNKNMVMKI